MDIVFIRDLKVHASIGVFDWERRISRPLYIDVDMAADLSRAAQSDDIADALDYAAVSQRIIELTDASRFQLLESLAEQIATALQSEFGIPWLRLQISKPGAVRAARSVGVIIERGER